ncbi:hypothetical protein ACWPM1_06565 [Tsuneonella sp. HG249]
MSGNRFTRLPSEPRMRYWRPDPELAGLVSGYHLYAVRPPEEERQRDVFQPAWPILRITFGEAGAWRVRAPGQDWQAVPHVALFGPTSGVTWSDSGRGLTIGIGILPRGWARLATQQVADWTNRVGDPGRALRGNLAHLTQSLAIIESDDGIPALLDRFLRDTLASARPEDPRIGDIRDGVARSPNAHRRRDGREGGRVRPLAGKAGA